MTDLESGRTTLESAQVPIVVEYPEIKLKVSEDPVTATCPFCHQAIVTDIVTIPGPFTLLGSVILCHCFLCWVPFVMDQFKDVKHNCPKCKSIIGIFKKI